VLVGVVAIAAAVGSKSLVSSSVTVHSPSAVRSPSAAPSTSTASPSSSAASPVGRSRNEQRDALGEAGGGVPDGTTVFDDEVPGVANLDPALLRALRLAATRAAADGVELVVNSGWRSPAYEDQLRREAIAKYGSEAQAARWVATGTTSPHVSGDAVDLGPAHATPWLSAHGAAYGLCQIYANEPWHYELRPDAVAHGCPRMYSDPTQDPRMQR
jgi:D-alanyl-D-alanine carboxypeptidase